jgi:plasmid replication initiation protein
MAEEQIVLPGAIVKKSNVLCRARWGVESVFEPRLVALVAARVHQDDQDFQMYEIPMRELTGDTNDGAKTYKIIESVTDSLMNKIITIRQEGSRSFAKYNVFSKCEYDEKTHVIRARFDPDLKPHYLGLKAKFTEYRLLEFLTLPSIYSQRIFEILKSWDDQPEVTLSLSDLHEMLNVPDSLQKDFAAFRRRVLEKAHKDISSKTDLVYQWEPIRQGKGKAVTAIRFVFGLGEIAKMKESAKKQKQADYKPALDCWQTKHRAKEECPIRQRGTGGRGKCKICLERIAIEQFGV